MGHQFKQHDTVWCLGCQLDSKLSGEAIASKILKKNAKLKFLFKQDKCLTSVFRRF